MRAHYPRCEDKDEELAYLRSELAIVDNLAALRDLRDRVGLRGITEARVLHRLYRGRHHTATRLQLEDMLTGEASRTSLDVFVCRLRARLTKTSIENIWGQGFRLTPEGVYLVTIILEGGAHHG